MKLKQSLLAMAIFLGGVGSAHAWAWCPPMTNEGVAHLNAWYAQYSAKWNVQVGSVGNFQAAMTTAEQTISATLDKMQLALIKKFNQSDANIENAINQFITDVNQQLATSSSALTTADAAIAEYENTNAINKELDRVVDEAEQPITNCMQFAAGQTLKDAFGTMKQSASVSALGLAQRAVNNLSDQGSKLSEYVKNKELYVSNTDPILKDADVNAALLFGGHTGTLTRYEPKHDEAAKTFISNIVRELDLPARVTLSDDGEKVKRLTNIQRRMGTYLGLSANSLENIRANHQANGDLVSFYEAAKLTPNENVKKYGVSLAEVVDTYATKMISPTVTASLAGAKNSAAILRQIAQNDAMRLWVKNQKIRSSERVQSLEAAKLALLAEDVLGKEANILLGITNK